MTVKMFSDYEAITFSREGRILTVTLNRADTLNAVNAKLHAELARVFTDVQRDPESDVVVLTGAGRAFSAGGDVDWMQDAIDNPEAFQSIAVEAKQMIFSQLELEKPLICRMNGHAMGLGATIALACDIVIASDQAKIGDPHVLIGYSAGDGGAFLWPQLVGYLRAKEYLLTGDPIPAVEAARMGLINRAVPPQQLDDEVYNLARRLASGARKAIRWTKVSINLGLKQLAHMTMDSSLAYEALTNLSKDHQEAVAAFREKRTPNFTGE
jgi:enoyl-CoA hydratase